MHLHITDLLSVSVYSAYTRVRIVNIFLVSCSSNKYRYVDKLPQEYSKYNYELFIKYTSSLEEKWLTVFSGVVE